MKKAISLITAFLSIVFIIFLVSCGKKPLMDECGCFEKYEEALADAGKKKQPMLVFFTSQGDDEESTNLVTDILKEPSFTEKIASKYTVFHADFGQSTFQKTVEPENATSAQRELTNTYTTIMQKNYQLAVLFNVSTMPAAFLCTKEGYVISQIQNTDDFANITDFEKCIISYNEKVEQFNNLIAATKKGSAHDKVEAIVGLYITTDPNYRSFLLPLVKNAIKLDKTNETGLIGKFILAQAEAEAMNSYSQGDVETAVKKYLIAANNEFLKPEEKQECFYTAAYLVVYSGSTDYDGIIEYMQTAYDLAPESPKADAIKQAISYFETVLEHSSEFEGE